MNETNFHSTVRKFFTLEITAPASTIIQSFELDKTIKYVRAISVSSTREEQAYHRGGVKMELNRYEIFPSNYECKKLMFSTACPVRYCRLGRLPIGNGILKVEYTDTDDSRLPFEKHTFRIDLDCELHQT